MNKPTIYITRKIPTTLLEPYQETFEFKMWEKEDVPVPQHVLMEESKQAQGLLCLITEKIDAEFLNHASHLKVMANMPVGYDNINMQAADENEISNTHTH